MYTVVLSHKKRSEMMPFEAALMDLVVIILCEVSKTETNIV